MRHYRLALVILAGLAGCAGQPHPAAPAAGAAAASGAASAAAATPAAAGAVAASGAAPAATAAPAAVAAEFKPPSGWSTRVKNGETVYCRSDNSVGSRIPIQYCLTQADLKEFLWREKRGVEDVERMRLGTPTVCPSGQVCN